MTGAGRSCCVIHIRPCRGEDFESVLALLKQLWPDKNLDARALRSVFDEALASDTQTYLCAVEGENILGFGSLRVRNNLWQAGCLGQVDELVVDAGHRGQGIGTQLLDALTALARLKGCIRIELDSAFHRTQAHRFYESRGFEKRAVLFSKAL